MAITSKGKEKIELITTKEVKIVRRCFKPFRVRYFFFIDIFIIFWEELILDCCFKIQNKDLKKKKSVKVNESVKIYSPNIMITITTQLLIFRNRSQSIITTIHVMMFESKLPLSKVIMKVCFPCV